MWGGGVVVVVVESRFSSTGDNLENKQCISKLKNYTPNKRVARGDLVLKVFYVIVIYSTNSLKSQYLFVVKTKRIY